VAYEAGYRQLVTKNLFLDVAGFFNQYGQLQGFLPAVVETDPIANPPEPAITTLYGIPWKVARAESSSPRIGR
jgi:hypothetical protein